MTFLPVVERELRVAARKRGTYWLRVAAAVGAMLIGCAFLLVSATGSISNARLGPVLFGVITWLAWVGVSAAGLFFTSDCLSEEKREGTLGFLFLTDLRGYDIVGGKLLATSLRCFFGLAAVVPVVAVTIIMGGVTGAQFWKTSVALLNTLFCSLALGVFVSAISRDTQRAMAGTFFLLLVWFFAGTILDFFVGMAGGQRVTRWSVWSPFYVFVSATAWARSPFWSAVGMTQLTGWLLLGLASVVLPHAWQERPTRRAVATANWSYSWRYGGERRRGRLRRKLLERNAALWLACRERWQAMGVWVVAILALITLIILLALKVSSGGWAAERGFGWVFTVALNLWLASQAGRFFVEARRSGLIELMLATPLTVDQIVQGQWRALVRLFGLPVGLIVAVDLTTQVLAGGPVGMIGLPGGAGASGGFALVVAQILMTLASALSWGANLAAICWFGMWMGMTSKNNNLATLKTILLVQVIPWMVIAFTNLLVIQLVWRLLQLWLGTRGRGLNSLWYPLVATAFPLLLNIGKDVVYLFWARGRLYSSFRMQAVRGTGTQRFVGPPAPPVPAGPPTIAMSRQ